MAGAAGGGDLSPTDARFRQLQETFERALGKGGLSDGDPLVKSLFSDFFKDDAAAASFISSHDGKISTIISQLDQLGLTEQKIQEFCNSVLQMQKGEKATKPSPITPIRFEKPVTLEFMCDVDEPDHNGAILCRFNRAIACENPVITTRTLFRASKVETGSLQALVRDEEMPGIEKHYDIYSRGAFLIFVPKHLGPSLTPQKRAEQLDLDPKKLKKITLEEAWCQTEDQPSIEGFRALFLEHPSHDKFLYIGGHGRVGQPAGLQIEHYKEFLEWAGSQRCKGLLVTSCHAGGASTLLHLASRDEADTRRFQTEQQTGVSFPVFIRSIGDFPTLSSQEAEKTTRSLFSKLADLLNSPGGRTVFRLRQVLQAEEEGRKKKQPENLVQVYFPHSSDSPGGFRPVGEGGESKALTYVRYRREQLEQGHIKISHKAFLELSPAIVECPIECKGQNPVVLSLIPGQAHHFLKEIRLDGITPQEFLVTNAKFYQQAGVGVRKVFFISSLKSEEKELNQVFIDLAGGSCGYRDGKDYFWWDVKKRAEPIKISPLQFVLRWKGAIDNSRPDTQALRAATGGHQSPGEVMKTLHHETFWGSQKKDHDLYQELLDDEAVKKISCEDYLKIISPMNLDEGEKRTLLAYLLPRNEALACELLQTFALAPDGKDELGLPLILHASQHNCLEFVKLLIEKGWDVNVSHPTTMNTPLHLAIRNKNAGLRELLLSQPTIDLKAKNARGNATYIRAIFDLQAFEACLAKDPSLDLNVIVSTPEGRKLSLLGTAIHYGSTEALEFLLKAGADPNVRGGEFSPLTEAIIKGDKEKLDLLLKYGASPYKKDAQHHYPILEAMRRSPVGVVEKLLKEKIPAGGKLEQQEVEAEVISFAIRSGEASKIHLALQTVPSLPEAGGFLFGQNLKKGLDRLHLFGRDDVIKEIAKHGSSRSVVLTQWCLDKALSLLGDLMDKRWDFPAIIAQVIEHPDLSPETRLKILSKAVELGADLNKLRPNYWFDSYISAALARNDLKVARLLIEKGADPQKATRAIVETGNIDLMALALDKGLPLEPKDPFEPPLLYRVAGADLSRKEMREAFEWLVAKGADVNQQHGVDTPFFRIMSSGNKELYDFCLAHGATLPLKNQVIFSLLIPDAIRFNPEGGEPIVKDLITRGVNLNAPGGEDYSNLFSAIVRHGSLDLVSWCVDQGAVISPENPEFKTLPLQSAAVSSNANAREIFELLVKKGGDLNQKGRNESLPIMPLLSKGDLELVKFCFDNGAKLEDEEQIENAFERVFKSGNSALLEELRNRGYAFNG